MKEGVGNLEKERTSGRRRVSFGRRVENEKSERRGDQNSHPTCTSLLAKVFR